MNKLGHSPAALERALVTTKAILTPKTGFNLIPIQDQYLPISVSLDFKEYILRPKN